MRNRRESFLRGIRARRCLPAARTPHRRGWRATASSSDSALHRTHCFPFLLLRSGCWRPGCFEYALPGSSLHRRHHPQSHSIMATKVALVTASSAGLGAACVKSLAPHFRVVVNYFSRPEKAEQLIKEAESIPLASGASSANPRFHSIQGDLGSRDDIKRMVQETVDKMGRLDLVVSNGGWTRMTQFADLEQQVNEEDWDKCFNLNVKSHLWLLYAAKPHFEANGEDGGSFITVASLAGVRPSGSSLPYSVTKAAQIHLMKGLATICGPKIRCNTVSPGLMMTEWGLKFPEKNVQAAREKGVLKILATPEDVADQVATMALSRSMTGQNIVIDGGVNI